MKWHGIWLLSNEKLITVMITVICSFDEKTNSGTLYRDLFPSGHIHTDCQAGESTKVAALSPTTAEVAGNLGQ